MTIEPSAPEPTPERLDVLSAAATQLQDLFRKCSLAQITPGDVRRIYEYHGVHHADERRDIADHVCADIIALPREGQPPLTEEQERKGVRIRTLLGCGVWE